MNEEPLPAADQYLLPVEVAGLLRVSKMTVYRLIEHGELPAYKIGRNLRVRQTDYETFLRDALVQPEA